MNKTLEFYFDFGSPTAYLACKRLQQLEQQYALTIDYQPILLGGIFKATDNVSPALVPAKGVYMNQHDLPRFARRYGVTLNINPFFPINTLSLMRGAIAAGRLGCFDDYLRVVYDAMWVDGRDMGEADVLVATLEGAGLDSSGLLQLSRDPAVKAELIDNTARAVERGAFGAPTMYMDGAMYFGQDRLDFIEETLRQD